MNFPILITTIMEITGHITLWMEVTTTPAGNTTTAQLPTDTAGIMTL